MKNHQRLRHVSAVLLVAVFLAVPWIELGGLPLARFELHSGRYFLAGKALPASSLINVVLLALSAALTLGLVSALWGRLWCGYACPQGVFVDLGVRALERAWEGPALARARLARTRSAFSRGVRRVGLHSSFLLLSVGFAFGVLSYFAAPRDLLFAPEQVHFSLYAVGTGIALLAFVDATVLRHRFCTTLCPYARLQTLLVDEGTKQIGYDSGRGEPRGRGAVRSTFKTEGQDQSKGDCIDCKACVRVCPTGIDIRNGVGQLECINCARCIDVCNGIMANLGRPTGLIRFDTEQALQGQHKRHAKRPSKNQNSQKRSLGLKPFRLRPFLYGTGLVLVLGTGLFRFAQLPPVQASAVNISPNGYVTDGTRIKNLLRVRVTNLSNERSTFLLSLAPENLPDVRIEFQVPLKALAPGDSQETTVLVSKERGSEKQGLERASLVLFHVQAQENSALKGSFSSAFSGPVSLTQHLRH